MYRVEYGEYGYWCWGVKGYLPIRFKVGKKALKHFNSHEWPRQNFSLQYQYNIKQTSDENKEKYKLREYKLIQYQILQTNITRTVWQTLTKENH